MNQRTIDVMSTPLRRTILLIQLACTLAVLIWIPGNISKAAALLVLWNITFFPISTRELVFYGIACAFFTAMNALSLKQGIFAFRNPDLLGMPYYEIFMWGFYLLHTMRMLGGSVPKGHRRKVWLITLLFAAAFGGISDQSLLFVVTAGLLILALAFFHEPLDLAYAGYMVILGAAIEYTGVWSGEWYYPGDPLGGVPPWFITLWGGVGLLLRRLVLPILAGFEDRRNSLAA
jgi:hypothetical protein